MKAAASGLTTPEANNVWQNGKKTTTPLFHLSFISSNTPHSRWRIQVPKKIIFLSTSRNRSRRIIREALRGIEGKLISQGLGIITVKQPVYEFKMLEVQQKLVTLLTQAQLLTKNLWNKCLFSVSGCIDNYGRRFSQAPVALHQVAHSIQRKQSGNMV